MMNKINICFIFLYIKAYEKKEIKIFIEILNYSRNLKKKMCDGLWFLSKINFLLIF